MPSEFLEMDAQEKAFVIAAIDIKIEDDKREAKKMNSQAPKKPRKGGKGKRRK